MSREKNYEFLQRLDTLHTTELGVLRIKKNLRLQEEDVVEWCRERIKKQEAQIIRKGKNWYIDIEDCVITVNAYSNTIITAHKKKEDTIYEN